MKDTIAKGNRFAQGVIPDEVYKSTRRTKGVPVTPGGVPRSPGIGATGGVPIPGGQSKYRTAATPREVCSATTKKGEPCKANPVKGKWLCVGHLRASG